MSWEAWGSPPDQEPELCPLCDSTCHTPDKCEVAASEERSRVFYGGVIEAIHQQRERALTEAYAEGRKDEMESRTGTVDWLGLALELEAQATRVESKSAMRAMYSAARGLRLMGAK